MIKAVIFDFFDVIRSDGYNRWLSKRGLIRDGAYLIASDKHDRGELTDDEFFAELARLSGETLESVEYEMEDGNELNTELVAYIATLHENFRTAILSNSSSGYLRNEIAMHQLDQYFDEIIISSEAGHIKPQKEIFDLATTRLDVKPEEAVFTDDNPRHIEGAQKAGLHALLFESTEQFRREFESLTADEL